MGSVRPETYYAGGQLIADLHKQGIITQMRHDGGDILLFDTREGHTISIHLIQSGIPLYEIRKILQDNTDQGLYTLFMLWCSMLLPNHGKQYQVPDWTEAFFALNPDDSIYGYDIFDGEIFMFPVHFRGSGPVRYIEYGTTIHPNQLAVRVVETKLPNFTGKWYVADFNGAARQYLNEAVPGSDLDSFYITLGVEPGDDRETVRRAYRLLARRYHPDTNTSPDAHDKMQEINEAYQKIIDALES